MLLLSRILLFVAGVINLLPSVLAFLPSKISTSYGLDILNVNYELLLRHRAVLFGIIGGLMMYASLSKKNIGFAFIAGSISMVSFIVLYFAVGKEVNNELTNVMRIDIAGIICLAASIILYRIISKKETL